MFSDMMFVLAVANTGLVVPVEGIVRLVMHHERVVHEVEAVRPRLEGIVNHLVNWGRTDKKGKKKTNGKV